jgi:hypothetical protein
MTTTHHPWITAELAPLARCADCDSDVVVVEDEPDVFTAVVEHNDSCPWYRAFVRGGADQIRLYRKDQP